MIRDIDIATKENLEIEKGVYMDNTLESFKEYAINAANEAEIDDICFEWLELLCNECGKRGKIALALLNIVRDVLTE